MNTIGAAKLKEQCLSILDHLDADGLVITKHGRPVARLVPHPRPSHRLIGCLAGKVEIRGDVMATGIDWNADRQP